MANEYSVDLWIERIRLKMESLAGNDPARLRALHLIGMQIQNEGRKNLTAAGMVMTGNLRQSLRYRITQGEHGSQVEAGVFGVPYARINERGGIVTPAMRRAMMRSLREAGRAGLPPKGVVRGSRFLARPYLAPAFRDSKDRILQYVVDMIREIFGRV